MEFMPRNKPVGFKILEFLSASIYGRKVLTENFSIILKRAEQSILEQNILKQNISAGKYVSAIQS